ncbi:MAG: tRNA (adenosine(37)-N6)-dimethylallyltransferase MiaA [Oscillospiraceae bacterium]|nr:tRNA (adenosine(37)-N6)-dimethylallyltransferase MiaA [Oscillospiraceae bacterium]
MQKPRIIVIVGPTASGKTALSIELAKKINGEIVSCDSMQIYKDMNIGTAKPTKEEMQSVKHHLIDCVLPTKRFSVSEYKKMATKVIKEILQKNKVPIVVGGTGLYVDSLIYGIEFKEMNFDEKYRNELNEIADNGNLNELYEQAKQIDPEAMKIVSPNDKKRIIRILEIYKATGKNKTEQNKESVKNENPYNYTVFAINWDREVLYDRINKRVDLMIKDGLIKEVEDLIKKYNNLPTAMQGLGYKEVREYLDGQVSEKEMIEKIKQETRKYAKRQITWFKKNKQTIWLNGEDGMEELINRILQNIST